MLKNCSSSRPGNHFWMPWLHMSKPTMNMSKLRLAYWCCVCWTKYIWYAILFWDLRVTRPCSVPEVIALPITGGNTKYLEWLKNSTRDNWSLLVLEIMQRSKCPRIWSDSSVLPVACTREFPLLTCISVTSLYQIHVYHLLVTNDLVSCVGTQMHEYWQIDPCESKPDHIETCILFALDRYLCWVFCWCAWTWRCATGCWSIAVFTCTLFTWWFYPQNGFLIFSDTVWASPNISPK